MVYLLCPLCCHLNEAAETEDDDNPPPLVECEVCGEAFDAEETRVEVEQPES